MITEVTVISEETQEYTGKKGAVKILRLAVLDNEAKCRFKQTFDYDLEATEKDRYAGKLVNKRLTLGISDFVTFGGRLRAKGVILTVHGDNGQPK